MGLYRVALVASLPEQIDSAQFWLERFYPDVQIEKLNIPTLHSSERTDAELECIWMSALLSETNYANSEAQRRSAIEDLVQ